MKEFLFRNRQVGEKPAKLTHSEDALIKKFLANLFILVTMALMLWFIIYISEHTTCSCTIYQPEFPQRK
jgi:hypothetical protein